MFSLPEFKNQTILERAFTHRSYLNEARAKNLESNERLEFLGDSILSMIVSSYIFNKYPELKEGELTNLRSVLTNTETLFQLAQKLNLGKYLKLSKGEQESGGRESRTILADTLEAIIGGLYLDQGLEGTQKFLQRILLDNLDEIIQATGLKDSKSSLQEIIQADLKVSPVYKIIKEEGPDHLKTYTVGVYVNDKLIATGIGHSKQEAEKEAATSALSTFKS